MQLSWNGIKISIAGARLSHLVQKDGVWDYGSMIEQVKTVFMQMEKAKKKDQFEFLRKYMTIKGYECFRKKISGSNSEANENVLGTVSILEVHVRNKHFPDRFCALIKGTKKQLVNTIDSHNRNRISENFSEQWLFLRQGDWWLLDKMK